MKFLLIHLCLALIAGVVFAEKPEMVYVVETVVAKEEPFSFKRRYIGTITSEYFSILKPQISGTIDEIKVKPEQEVKKDQILFSLDNASQKAAVEIDRKNVALVKRSFARNEQLRKSGDISKAQSDQAHLALLQAEQKLTESLKILKNSEVRAPFDGIVGVPRVVLGESVTPQDSLISIRKGAYSISFRVPASRLKEIAVGQKVLVNKETALISAVERSIDPSTRTGFAKAILKQCERCIVGSSVFAEVTIEEKPKTILLNKEAIFYQRSKPFIMVVKSNDKGVLVVEEREIRVGHEQNGMIEILSGIKSGEIIVKANPKRLRNGVQVKVVS